MALPRLAPQRSNPGTLGQNVRYDLRGYQEVAPGHYVDPSGFHYSGDVDNALSDDRPDTVVGGLFPADDERARAATYAGMPGQWKPGQPMPNQSAPRLIGQATRMLQSRKKSAKPTARPHSPLSQVPDEQLAQAQSRVQPVIAGAASALIEALIGQATNSSREIDARSSAIAQQLGQYAPKAAGYYGAAAQQSQGVGNAVSNAIRATGGALQSDLASQLSGIQAPGQATDLIAGGAGARGDAAANAAGGLSSADVERLHGYGGAAEAMMGALPRIAGLAGDQQKRGILLQLGQDLNTKLADLYGKEPSMILDAMDAQSKLAADAAKQASLDRYRQQQLGLSRQRVQQSGRRITESSKQANARLAESRRYHDVEANLSGGRLGVSQYNAQTSRLNAQTSQGRLNESAAQHAAQNAQAWARIATGQKNAGISAARNQLAWEKFKANPHGTGATGGYTKHDVLRLQQTAGEQARQAFKGYWALDDDPDTPLSQSELVSMMKSQDVTSPSQLAGVGQFKRSYQEAMSKMLDAHVPLTMAQSALDRYWTKPGMHQPWEHPGAGRPKHSFQERHPGASGKAAAGPSVGAPGEFVLPTAGTWRPTHVTDGLSDQGFTHAEDVFPGPPGTPVGAPEDGVVLYFHPEGAQGGGSMELRTASGRVYWIGHVENGVPHGTRVRRGQTIAAVANQHVSSPHVHIDYRG